MGSGQQARVHVQGKAPAGHVELPGGDVGGRLWHDLGGSALTAHGHFPQRRSKPRQWCQDSDKDDKGLREEGTSLVRIISAHKPFMGSTRHHCLAILVGHSAEVLGKQTSPNPAAPRLPSHRPLPNCLLCKPSRLPFQPEMKPHPQPSLDTILLPQPRLHIQLPPAWQVPLEPGPRSPQEEVA